MSPMPRPVRPPRADLRSLTRLGVLLLGALVVTLGGCAGTPTRTAADVPDYEVLVRDLAAGRSTAWDALAPAFLARGDFSARLDELTVLTEQLEARGARDPVAVADAMLDRYYGDLRAHELRHRGALAVGDADAAAFHLAAHDALVAAIEATGDGSEEAPYAVLSANEALAWLQDRDAEILGALYEVDDEAPSVTLLLRTRMAGADGLEDLRFDLGATFRARRAVAAALPGGGHPSPSQVLAARAAQGDAAAQATYALALWQSDPAFAQRAIELLSAASDAGNLIARETLGAIYGSLASSREGDEARELLDRAVDQFLLAVNQGSASAMYNLAQLYLSGHFGEENQFAGVSLLEQSADRDNVDALVLLARLHYNGQFVAQDRDRAVTLLERACARGHTDAQLFYARHLLTTDEGVGFDEQAAAWLTEAADAGASRPAMMLLATLLAEGEHMDRDASAAVGWFKRAAEGSGDAELVNSVAWILAVAEDRALRDPAAGLALMTTLMEEDGDAAANPAYLDTWAAAHAATGDFEGAVRVQTGAVAIAEDELDPDGNPPDYLPVLREHLELFENGGTVSEDVP